MDGRYGELFRQLREAKGLSLERAAGDVVSVSQLSRFEKGQSELVVSKLFALLDNIIVSPEEYVRTLRDYDLDPVEAFGLHLSDCESVGDFEGLAALRDGAWAEYEQTGKVSSKLNALSVQAILAAHDKAAALSPDDLQFVIDFLFGSSTWGGYELRVFIGMVPQLPYQTCLLFLDQVLRRTEFFERVPPHRDLVLMALRNVIGRAIDEADLPTAKRYLGKFKQLGRGVGAKLTYQELLSGYYQAKGQPAQGAEALSPVVFYYEHFGSNRYLAEVFGKERDRLLALAQAES